MNKDRKAELEKEHQWLPEVIEMIDGKLLDKGYSCDGEWLGYYDEYVLHYARGKRCYDHEMDYWFTRDSKTLEVHSKHKVFNPYKFVGGDGHEFRKISEMNITKEKWEIVEKWIRWNDYTINGKKIDLFSDPYYERPRFYQGSDVPLNGYYE